MGRLRRSAARSRRSLAVSWVAAVLGAALLVPATVTAHPLGNFTINTYAGLRVSTSELRLDLVIDMAEIPTFEERLRLDTNGDYEVSDAEIEAAREPECAAAAAAVSLVVDGTPAPLELAGTGLRFPPGAAAGVLTMRLVCEFVAGWPGDVLSASGAGIELVNRAHEGRLGWREIVVEGDGVTVDPVEGELASSSLSARLTAYPEERLDLPLDQSSVSFVARPGGAPLPPLAIPDAAWLPGFEPAPRGDGGGGAAAASPAVTVPGGVAADIPAIFRTADLSPALTLLAMGAAVLLGAGHALTPGHGKTLMAAYLVGTRGTALHAAGLGLSVTVSHTLGILALALLITGAQSALPPDVVIRALPTLAAATIVLIGAWMLAGELRRRRATAAARAGHDRDQTHAHDHDHGTDHEAETAGHGEHSHGGVRHTHLPAQDTTITWRSLVALGLAGGLIPSTSALVILLGTIATGRTAFGVVLVVAFGLGMAIVMGGIGLLLVRARGWLDRMPRRSALGRLAVHLPLLAAVVVLGMGLLLTGQAITGRPAL